MKSLITLLMLLIAATGYSRIDTVQTRSEITDVTVFFSGAQITRTAKVKLKPGKQMLMLSNLPRDVFSSSIQVAAMNNCKILSVKHQLKNVHTSRKSSEELSIERAIEAQKQIIHGLKNRQSVFDIEEKIILDNSQISRKDGGVTISEIREAADFYRVRLNDIREQKLGLYNQSEEANKKIQELYVKLNEITIEKRSAYSQVIIAVDSDKEHEAELKVNYYIGSAGWEPHYDFRVAEITEPLVVVYQANVFQSTGEDWNKVNITLSSNNPSLSGHKPDLRSWYLGRKSPYQQDVVHTGAATLTGRVLEEGTDEAIPFVNIVILKGSQQITGTSTDFDGNYTIKPITIGSYDLLVTSIGYQPVKITGVVMSANKITFQNVKMKASKISLSEFEVVEYQVPLISKDGGPSGATISMGGSSGMPGRSAGEMTVRGSREENSTYYLDGVQTRGSSITPRAAIQEVGIITGGTPANYSYSNSPGHHYYGSSGSLNRFAKNSDDFETINFISNSLKSVVGNLEYAIEIPYTIPSDGADHSIKIKESSVPVNYVYYAVPKLDSDVFLTAEVSNWAELNLLSGKSSIYYQGTYTGQTFIDADHSGDTLRISLGRDKSIIVKHESNKQLYDKRLLGNNYKEIVGWDITVRNNKQAKVKIMIEDQHPLSDRKSIEVELTDAGGSKVNEKTGEMLWELELAPNERKVLSYTYGVKYPRTMNLTLK